MQKWVISYKPSLIWNFRTLSMTSILELKLPKWICSYLWLFESSFSQQCDWKTKNAYVFQFSHIYLTPLLFSMFSSADNDILCQGQQASLMTRLLMNFFQGQLMPLHYVTLLCIIFWWKMHAHIHEQKISSSFFLPVKEFSSPPNWIWWHTIHIYSLQSSEKL